MRMCVLSVNFFPCFLIHLYIYTTPPPLFLLEQARGNLISIYRITQEEEKKEKRFSIQAFMLPNKEKKT